MKIITTLGIIAIVVIATIGVYISADPEAEAHRFKAEELEIQAEVITDEAKSLLDEASRVQNELNRLKTQRQTFGARPKTSDMPPI